MPQIFKPLDPGAPDKDIVKDYYDKHTPRLICDDTVNEGEKFKVKIKMGDEHGHPDEGDHYISIIQLWNRETLVAETTLFPGTMGNMTGQVEVDFYIVPKVSMNLLAMSYCTKHGYWQSTPKEVKVIHPAESCNN